MSRKLPNIDCSVLQGYAALIAHNFDTVQESFKVGLPDDLVQRLEAGKQSAIEKHEGQGTGFCFGGAQFQIWSGASQGKKWVIENDDIQIHFGPQKQDWPVTVRYLAGGLWEHGFWALKERVVNLLMAECRVEADCLADWCHLTRADYCFDFYSPAFSSAMGSKRVRENVVAPSGVKIGTVGPSTHDETLTIGFCKSSVQVQVYDKGQEITEKSGKIWMFKVWEREGYLPPDDKMARDVWRVEIRFGKEFLKNRGIKTFEEFFPAIKELLAEAILTRRLCIPDGTAHRERWPLHPLWAAVYEAAGSSGHYLPIGRQITMRKDEYIDMLRKQSNGIVRAAVVAESGHYFHDEGIDLGLKWASEIAFDPDHHNKVDKNREKFRFFNEAK